MKNSLKLDESAAARITGTTTAADVPEWTSVAHLSLVLDLEQTFAVTFDNDEIVNLGSVTAIQERLQAKLAGGGT